MDDFRERVSRMHSGMARRKTTIHSVREKLKREAAPAASRDRVADLHKKIALGSAGKRTGATSHRYDRHHYGGYSNMYPSHQPNQYVPHSYGNGTIYHSPQIYHQSHRFDFAAVALETIGKRVNEIVEAHREYKARERDEKITAMHDKIIDMLEKGVGTNPRVYQRRGAHDFTGLNANQKRREPSVWFPLRILEINVV